MVETIQRTEAGVLAATIPFGLLHFQEYGNSWRHAVLIALAGASFGWMRQANRFHPGRRHYARVV